MLRQIGIMLIEAGGIAVCLSIFIGFWVATP